MKLTVGRESFRSSFPRRRESLSAGCRIDNGPHLRADQKLGAIPACAGFPTAARRVMTSLFSIVALIALISFRAHAQDESRILDNFADPSAWRVVTSNQVSGALRQVQGADGKALCLDYDFNGVSGYAGLQRDLALDYPENYRFDFKLRGDSPRNDLQFKLVDASGDNVWWVNKPRYDYPAAWTAVYYKKRHIDKAWGPDPDRVLRKSAKLEFTVYNNAGGKGSVCFDELTFTLLPPQPSTPYAPKANVVEMESGKPAGNDALAPLAVDDPGADTSLVWSAADAPAQPLVLDLGASREFGGLSLRWGAVAPGVPKAFASDYEIGLSEDGRQWRIVRTVSGSNGGSDWIALPESEARYLRLRVLKAPASQVVLENLTIQPLAFAETPNAFLKSVARQVPKGWFPRGFSDEQSYWTLVGLDGGLQQALIGEDGGIEIGRGAPSVSPMLYSEGKLVTWPDVQISQSLQDGYLPIPSVEWKDGDTELKVTAFAQGTPAHSQLVARYRLSNRSDTARDYVLALAVQPFQVNPPTQFLSTVGGFSPINTLQLGQDRVSIDGKARIFPTTRAAAVLATTFDAGMIGERLDGAYLDRPAAWLRRDVAADAAGMASGALLYPIRLEPGESRELGWVAPLQGDYRQQPGFDLEAAQSRVAASWRAKLDGVRFEVPPQGQALVNTLRTATAHMLISRIGPRLQPGTRSYARSWIRDGAMISEGLLRMGREEVVRDYVDFYAPYQFKDGMVPCCVDDRGSDPVPENDSHGELIFNIAELYRYDGDKAFLRSMWPHVLGAYTYMEKLRLSERTEANRAVNPAFYGMMPRSISHEGYSAKPMHSYWDNFWALRGYKDAVDVARWLGKEKEAKRFEASRDEFRQDLQDSLRAAAHLHGIDFLPGAAELGDFDATSTTIALAPGGEQGRLPEDLLHNTFERYWREFEQRRDGKREWKDYTPYEWRNVAAFVRLGWRERAWEAVQFFFKDRVPQPWNQWAEVVSRTPRTPFFLGDLPHAWVGSDFVRSALDMFAYSREIDDSVVLAAGIPADWLQGKGIAIRDLRTPNGKLGYSLQRVGAELRLRVDAGLELPAGGVVLPWPYDTAPGATLINGVPAQWKNGELRVTALPATVVIAAP